ncbi:MAG: 23S rRNA (pseudouridine(1915)-N(3))-methyltransferase RlmH [Elusimicrobia bacterium]|nr:23S rRNA (pseudouridine(1915)-N(3))-methyltransferase RlmH [Elusimicrobiota bacterium]
MRLHIITVGKPKLAYARAGWEEYFPRLARYHQLRATHIPDKRRGPEALLAAAGKSCKVALVVDGAPLSSPELARFLDQRALEGREVSFLVGGPEGLPADVAAACAHRWSLSRLTLPHDLAMVVLLESLYRASTIQRNHPYHK